MTTASILRQMLRGCEQALVLAVLLIALTSFVQASSIVSLAPIIDLLIHPSGADLSPLTQRIFLVFDFVGIPHTFLAVCVVFVGIIIVKNLLTAIAHAIVARMHFRIMRRVILEEFSAFLGARWHFFVSKSHGTLSNTVLKETEKVGLAFESLAEMLSKSLELLFYFGLAVLISAKLTVAVMVLLGLGVLPFLLLSKVTYRIGFWHTSSGNAFHAAIFEAFSAMKLILGFGASSQAKERLEAAVRPYMDSAFSFLMVRQATPLGFEPIGIAIALVAVFLGFSFFHVGVSELFVMLYAFRMASQRAMDIAGLRNALSHHLPALEQIQQLKNVALQNPQRSGTLPFTKLVTGIELSNVSFQYPGRVGELLTNISLRIPKGKMVAIVGPSGGGKTTLLDLLLGFYPIERGQFLIDGVPFSEIDVVSFRQRIGYVPQEPFLFHASIRENLLWARPHADQASLENVLLRSNALEFVRELPQGMDTVVGERGVRLSGGQRQRLALARALLREPEVLILDEATSSLDSESEQLIQQSLEQLAGATTMVVVAHRLSTIQAAEYIYVIHDGAVIEEGTFDALLAGNGAFLKTAELQGFTRHHFSEVVQ